MVRNIYSFQQRSKLRPASGTFHQFHYFVVPCILFRLCLHPDTSMNSSTHITSLYTRTTHIVSASSPAATDAVTVRRSLVAPLQLVVDEYVVDNGGRAPKVNLVMTHGTSFNRCFWRLIIDTLLPRLQATTVIGRLLAIDAANHGDSAVLNGQRLPSIGSSSILSCTKKKYKNIKNSCR